MGTEPNGVECEQLLQKVFRVKIRARLEVNVNAGLKTKCSRHTYLQGEVELLQEAISNKLVIFEHGDPVPVFPLLQVAFDSTEPMEIIKWCMSKYQWRLPLATSAEQQMQDYVDQQTLEPAM